MDTPPTQADPNLAADPLLEPFRQEILSLLQKPFTVAEAAAALPKLERTIAAAQATLMLRDAKSRLRRTPWQSQGWGVSMNPPIPYPDDATPEDLEAANARLMADRETYGTKALREIVSTLRPTTQSATELVKAIAEARALGLDEVVDELMKQLRQSAMMPTDASTATRAAVLGPAIAKAIDDADPQIQQPPPLEVP